MSLGVLVRLTIENQSRNKHVESWNIRRLDEGSNPSDSTINKKRKQKCFLFLFQIILMRGEKFISSEAFAESR